MSEPRDHAITILVFGRFRSGSDLRAALETLAATLNTTLPALSGFVPGHPPVTIVTSELMTEYPIGWPKIDDSPKENR